MGTTISRKRERGGPFDYMYIDVCADGVYTCVYAMWQIVYLCVVSDADCARLWLGTAALAYY